jgi:hypothetical protein
MDSKMMELPSPPIYGLRNYCQVVLLERSSNLLRTRGVFHGVHQYVSEFSHCQLDSGVPIAFLQDL